MEILGLVMGLYPIWVDTIISILCTVINGYITIFSFQIFTHSTFEKAKIIAECLDFFPYI